MTCYNPKLRIENINKTETAKDGHKYHPAIITAVDNLHETLERHKDFSANYKKTIIPCRKCIGCKLDYAREWGNRGYLEIKEHPENNYFVTLTYDDKKIPKTESGNMTLKPEDLSLFIKNIRQYMQRDFNHTGIKYISAGEYGSKTERPHYHIIFFNLPLPNDDLYETKLQNGNYFSRSKTIEKYWKGGISNVSVANWNTISYVSRYVVKKWDRNTEDYQDRIPEFIRVSKGIGKEYYEKNKKKIITQDQIYIKNNKGVFTAKPPKYYNRLLKKENNSLYEEIKEKREKQVENQQKIRDQTHTYGRLGELKNQEYTKAQQTITLQRNLQ